MPILAQITSDEVLDTAYEWLCRRRRDCSAKLPLFYVRFMDDILILAPSRWQLRGAVRVVNQTRGALSLEKHRDKTFIGRIERGFDFLGYHFSPAGLSVAKQTIENFIEKASRLYEHEPRAGSAASPLEMYVGRWLRWAKSGIEHG